MKDLAVEPLKELQASGFRLTKARRTLFGVLKAEPRPLTATELVGLMKKKGSSADKTTVYRELTFLQERGLVQSIQFGDRQKRYELRAGHHHHLVCESCGIVIDVALKGDLDAIEKTLAKKTGFRIDDHSLEFFGQCADCR